METEFTPLTSLFGGGLIGLAAVMLMSVHGRIFGATGILSGAIFGQGADRTWRWWVIAGMIVAPLLIRVIHGDFPNIEIPVNKGMLISGGVLVGIGVTIGGGCTSGHGVCGLARFSVRSLVATVVFMAVAIITIYVIRHGSGA